MNVNHQSKERFFQLLRLSLGIAQEFSVGGNIDEWRWLYQTAIRQSLVGVCCQGLHLLPEGSKPPMEIAIQWIMQAETIRGLNELHNTEAARLTRLFGEAGRKSAILKGQANAWLYPDRLSRQPGDIDIWVEGGQESVIALLREMGFVNELSRKIVEGKATLTSHHVQLPANEKNVEVEVHFRPTSGNKNPFTNRRLQRWLEAEIQAVTLVENGFNVPSTRFALVMQLSHIQCHFLGGGIGLRHVCDYYMLLKNASTEDRQTVSNVLGKFGLQHTAAALMWVLVEVLHIDARLILCNPDNYRGRWMLCEIMKGGNFGQYAKRQCNGILKSILETRKRHFRFMRFDFMEMLWMEIYFWIDNAKTIPLRIKYKTLLLRNAPI